MKLLHIGCGAGDLDHNKIDWFFVKKINIWNNIISRLLPIVHRKHYKRLNKLLINEIFK